MSHRLISALLAALLALPAFAQNSKDMAKIYDFKTTNNKGAEVDFAQFEGKVLMVVNTASKCGFTPQYDGLEALYQAYKDKGLVIIGFPCDQFAGQEPGDNEQIAEFCRLNHGVTFPLMAKTEVNGPNAEPVFEYLKAQAPAEEYIGFKAKATAKMLKGLSKSMEKDSDIRWNFTKFLVNRDGSVVRRYAPTTAPEDIEKDIRAML